MKIVNVMNFVRRIDERQENSTEKLYNYTKRQLDLLNEYALDNTFLLQYDALCDDSFVELFKNEATEKTELGLWFEIVEPLTTVCGIPYRSKMGWKWDWHIDPGFSMAYTPAQRELLIDEAMSKFKEVFGYYPKTVASWLIDTHTLNHLSKNYSVSMVAICRDQANTDAYTLLGGYFNQAYYPSKNNIFTPAQTKENQINIPVFRLLSPCPIHNYDNNKYSSDHLISLGAKSACFTLEPGWYMGSTEGSIRWMFDCYFDDATLGFSYAHVGQENTFFVFEEQVFSGLRLQLDILLERVDVEFKKMSETGDWYRAAFPELTPATSVVASNNFDSVDVQSVYYDCKNYTANLFRFEDAVFLRSLFLFDERVKDHYLENTCKSFDAIYENLPMIDTRLCTSETKKRSGLMICNENTSFETVKKGNNELEVSFGESRLCFFEDRLEIFANKLVWYTDSSPSIVGYDNDGISFEHNGTQYRIDIENAVIIPENDSLKICSSGGAIKLFPRKT